MKADPETTASSDRLHHELRQPLSVIVAFAELLEDEISGPLNKGQHDYVLTIRRAAEDLESMIQELSDRASAASLLACDSPPSPRQE